MKKTSFGLATLILHLAITSGISPAAAEEPPVLQPGSLVRVTLVHPDIGTLQDPKVISGTLVELTETDLTLQRPAAGTPTTVPLTNLAELELNVQEGRRTRGAINGMGIGILTGVVLVLVSDAADKDDPDDWELIDTKTAAVFSGFILGSAGALVGALVSPGARWESIPTDGIRVGVGGGRRGESRLYLAFRF